MKTTLNLFLFVLVSTSIQASNIPPVAVINSTPDQTWFYNLEELVFDKDSSYDPDGYINYAKWYINGVYQTGGPYFGSMSICFALYGSPANGCYQLASGVTTVTVGLEVRDNEGKWSNLVTETYTIQEHKGRKYFVKDHIGNVRATVNRDGNVLGFDDYYPYGLQMPGRSNNTANPNDNYKFTGHEQDDEAELTMVHMNARGYDPLIGRFNQMDPLMEFTSPYTYVGNNPLGFTDPTGMSSCGSSYVTHCGEDGEVYTTSKGKEDADARHDERTGYVSKYYTHQFLKSNGFESSGSTSQTQTSRGTCEENPEECEDEGDTRKIDVNSVDPVIGTPPLPGGFIKNPRSLLKGWTWIKSLFKPKKSSQILTMSTNQLQSKFKHAKHFGVTGNWNKVTANEFRSAINQHINSQGVQVIQGTYRGQPVIHYLNPKTGLNVISSKSGEFISGWRLNSTQLQNIIKHGGL